MATGRNNDDLKKAAASSQSLTDETTAASSYTGILTFDLVVDILCRLPVKSLMQLRCVCKSWNSLISDPNFANKHLCLSRTQLNRHHLLRNSDSQQSAVDLYLWDTQLPSFFNSASTGIRGTRLRYPFNIQPHGRLIGSCNGILCFSNKKDSNSNASVIVWNPSIRKFKTLPTLEDQSHCGGINFAFGYDSLTHTYKVVAFYYFRRKSDEFSYVCKIHVKLHTMGKDTWETIEGFPSCYGVNIILNIVYAESGKFVSGAINWLVEVPSSSWVLSFDLGKESFQEILPPDYGEACDLTLGVLRDCLCIFSQNDTLLVIHVWIMKDYGNQDSWTKLFVVPYKELFGCQHPTYALPLYISEDHQLLLDLGEKVELAVYNSRDGTRKKHEVLPTFSDYRNWFTNHVYVESLISP